MRTLTLFGIELIRNRVSSTLELVKRINRYERVFVSEYKMFYIVLVGLLSGL